MTTIIKAHIVDSITTLISNNGPLIFYFTDFFDPTILSNMQERFGRPDAVICDLEGTVKDIGYPFYFVPALDLWYLDNLALVRAKAKHTVIDKTNYCFCWSINRKHIDRYLVIRLIEYLGLANFRYTWSGIGRCMDSTPLIADMQKISDPWLTTELKSHIMAPIQLEKRWVAAPDATRQESHVRLEQGEFLFMADTQHQLSRECAVYLLTESMTDTYQHYSFSEKTIWCLLNGCFPIWAGNYGQAEMVERMGIDVFADVIDHSYQYKNTLLERCWYALSDNIKILTDLEFASEMRNLHQDRLYLNMQWVREYKLRHYLDEQRNKLSEIGIDLDPQHFRFSALL